MGGPGTLFQRGREVSGPFLATWGPMAAMVVLLMIPGLLLRADLPLGRHLEGVTRIMAWGRGQSTGAWASSWMAFVLVSGCLAGIGIPRLWVSSAAGALFGVWAGISAALAASLMGAAIGYGIGNLFFSRGLQKRAGQWMRQWLRALRGAPFQGVLYARLFPFSNAWLVAVLGGAMGLRFSRFMAGSFIGFLPLTMVCVLLGHGSFRVKAVHIALGFGLMALTALATRILRARAPQAYQTQALWHGKNFSSTLFKRETGS